MKSMRILVTGASGQLGGMLVDRFSRAGYEVVGMFLSNAKPGLVHLDITDCGLSHFFGIESLSALGERQL